MSDVQPPELIVFYTDSCLGKKFAEALREVGCRVERHLDHFAEDAPDVDWLPVVSQRGWVILSKDKAMKPGTIEFEAILASGARMFHFGRGNYTAQAMINIILPRLDKIVAFVASNPPPFIVSLSHSGLRVVHPRATVKLDDDSGSTGREWQGN